MLGASAGLKHPAQNTPGVELVRARLLQCGELAGKRLGTRRLGRSGLAHLEPIVNSPRATDNVWSVDCSTFFPPVVSGIGIHGAYFVTDTTIALIRNILSGIDRSVLDTTGALIGAAWPPK